MEAINDRIAWCVKDSKLTKTAFAEKINVSQSFISRLVSGEKVPSDRTIADICPFHDNESAAAPVYACGSDSVYFRAVPVCAL